MPNPYRQARELLGLTQQEVALSVECSPSAVLYNEQGLYVAPLPVVHSFFSQYFKPQSLRDAYYRFQAITRADNRRMWILSEVNVFREPIKATIVHNGLRPTRFCKMFCCQPVLINNPKRISGHLEKIMLAAGFTPVQIDELRERILEYTDRQRSEDLSVH